MKKLFLLIALISIGAFSQTNPSVFKNGVDTKLIALDTLTTVQRDALTLKASKGYVIFNATTNTLNLHNGTSWGEVTGGGATNLTTSQTPTTVTIISDTGADAPIGLGNGTFAGVSLNDYSNADKALVASALQSADLSNYVTTNTTQTVTGNKTFNASVTNIGNGTINNKLLINTATPSIATPLFEARTAGIVRSVINGYGAQAWYIRDVPGAELGNISYNSFDGSLGISLSTTTTSQRFDMIQNGTYFSLKHFDLETGSGINLLHSNGYVGIGKNNPTTMLDVNGAITATTFSGAGTGLTGAATGFTSGITNSLKSATTTVNVSSATAPTTGQVLTATSSTTATWQTPSGGSFDPSLPQTITAPWEFSNTLTVEDGISATDAINKGQLDSAISAAVIGIGTGATPVSTTFTGGETTWNTGVTITDSHQLTLGSGTGIQSLLHRGVDYTWAGSTFTFINLTLPIAAGEVAFYYPNVAVPINYSAGEVAVAPSVNGNTDVQSVLEDHETRFDALETGGTPTVITNITKYTTFAALPTVTGTEDDTYAYVTEDTNLDLRGLYAIVGGVWKFIYHFEDLNIPVKRTSINEIDLSQPIITSTTTAEEEGIINGYNIGDGTETPEVDAGMYISNFIPVRLGDRLLLQSNDRFWFYYKDKTAIPSSEGIVPYNWSDRISITNELVAYVRVALSISTKNVSNMVVKQYNAIADASPSGWDDFNGGSTNFQRDNDKYTYEKEGVIFENVTNNLFDYKKGYYPNGFVYNTGATNGESSTELIACKSIPYSTNLGGNTNITYWDANKSYLSGTIAFKGFLPPANAKYFRVNFDKASDFKTLIITQGTKADNKKIIKISSETLNANENAINKSVTLIGDSIGTEQGSYASESAFASISRQFFNYRYFINNSVSGIATSGYYGDIDAGAYDMTNTDEYWIQIQTNDFGYNRGLGTLAGTSADNDYHGNMKYLVEQILVINPNAKIVWFTSLPRSDEYTPNAAGNTLQDYREAMIAYAQSRGDECLDLANCFNPFNTELKATGTVTGDGLHPNDNTHNIYIKTKILPFLKYKVQ